MYSIKKIINNGKINNTSKFLILRKIFEKDGDKIKTIKNKFNI